MLENLCRGLRSFTEQSLFSFLKPPLVNTYTHRRRSSVNAGEITFFARKYGLWKINKMSELYMIIAWKIFPEILGATCPLPPSPIRLCTYRQTDRRTDRQTDVMIDQRTATERSINRLSACVTVCHCVSMCLYVSVCVCVSVSVNLSQVVCEWTDKRRSRVVTSRPINRSHPRGISSQRFHYKTISTHRRDFRAMLRRPCNSDIVVMHKIDKKLPNSDYILPSYYQHRSLLKIDNKWHWTILGTHSRPRSLSWIVFSFTTTNYACILSFINTSIKRTLIATSCCDNCALYSVRVNRRLQHVLTTLRSVRCTQIPKLYAKKIVQISKQ